MTSCYCASCKEELAIFRITDEDLAWCPECRRVVDMSWFQVPGWVLGVVVMLATCACLPVALVIGNYH